MSEKLIYIVKDCNNNYQNILYSTTDNPLRACEIFCGKIVNPGYDSDFHPYFYTFIVRPIEYDESVDGNNSEKTNLIHVFEENNDEGSIRQFKNYCQEQGYKEIVATLTSVLDKFDKKKIEENRKKEMISDITSQINRLKSIREELYNHDRTTTGVRPIM